MQIVLADQQSRAGSFDLLFQDAEKYKLYLVAFAIIHRLDDKDVIICLNRIHNYQTDI